MPNVMQALAREQIKQGDKVQVATFRYNPDWPLKEELNGVPVRRVDHKSRWLPFYLSGYRNFKHLTSNIQQPFSPDILHLHMPFSGLAAISVMPKVPAVYTFHGSWAEEYEVEARNAKRETRIYKLEAMVMRWIEKRALSQADVIVTLSKFMQKEAKKYQIKPEYGWEIIPSGVDLRKFHSRSLTQNTQFRKEHNVPENAFFIFTARRLAKRMGLENLIEAVKIAKEKIPEIYLIIGGKGELREELELLVTNYQLLDFVRLEGFIPENKIASYMSAADLFVLPTQALEGFGLINLEAMGSGTPVLGTPVGAIPEVIAPFKEKFVLNGTSPQDIAEGIINFYREYKDDQELRKAAREYAEGFSWERMVEEYGRLYSKILNSKHEIRNKF